MFAKYNMVTARSDTSTSRSVSPMYWGLVLAVFTCGIGVVQAHYYFRKNEDRPWLRAVAGVIFSFDLVSTALVIGAVFQYFVPHFGDVSHISQVTDILAAECAIGIFITFIVQFYFGYQIYCVKPPVGFVNKVLIWTLAFFAIMSFLFGCVCFAMMFIHSNWEHWALAIEIGFSGSKGFAVLFDFVSTIVMCIHLRYDIPDVRSNTKRIVRFLVLFFIQRGALVTIVQTMLFVVDWAFKQEMYWLTPHLLVTRLYVNTFFAMLNSRKYLRNKDLATEQENESVILPNSLVFKTDSVSARQPVTTFNTIDFNESQRNQRRLHDSDSEDNIAL